MKKTTIFNEQKLNKNCSTLCKFYLRSSGELLLFPKKSSSRDPIVRIGKTQFGFLKYICSHYFFCKICAFFCEIFCIFYFTKISQNKWKFLHFSSEHNAKTNQNGHEFFFSFHWKPYSELKKKQAFNSLYKAAKKKDKAWAKINLGIIFTLGYGWDEKFLNGSTGQVWNDLDNWLKIPINLKTNQTHVDNFLFDFFARQLWLLIVFENKKTILFYLVSDF